MRTMVFRYGYWSVKEMGILDRFRHKDDLPVVFYGDYLEAELVIGMLKAGGFHPYEISNMPRVYLGIAGGGRVFVPPEEMEEARAYLACVREAAEQEGGGSVLCEEEGLIDSGAEDEDES